VPGLQPADAVECRAYVRQEGDRGRLLRGRYDSRRWVDSPSDLFFSVAVLPESGPEKLHFTMQTLLVTKGTGPVYQC
jgi:hypothetical protein